jgi:UDP-N-acetylglucosamine 1-carboxyvinyltransferase
MTGGELLLKMDREIGEKIMMPVFKKLQQAGVSLSWTPEGLEVQRDRHDQIKPVNVTAEPFPGFPTDLLPQWVTFMTLANGPSILHDTIYDNRFQHVPHLVKMGAEISIRRDKKYKVHGKAKLRGTRVVATDLRAGAALILAALVAEGHTVIKEFQHVLRGYENIKEKLSHGWSVRFTSLPQTRPGLDGGNRS